MKQAVAGEPDPSFWASKTVLVTGSGGFAGARLTERLHELGANVRCFIRAGETPPVKGPRAETVLGDVRDYQSLLNGLEGTDVAFHLAAVTAISETRANLFNTFATDSLGTLNFLMAAKESRTDRLVHASTCQVYGKQDKFPITEDAPAHPIDIYSASKLAGEILATSSVEMYELNLSISRAFNHYGPRQRPGFLIPEVILGLLKGRVVEMRNPSSTRDFAYVDDVVRGYILLAEKGRGSQIYHFCSGVERSVEAIVGTIAKVAGVRAEFGHKPGAAGLDVGRSVGDYSKANRELGWEPQLSFEDSIERTLSWYKAHPQIEGA